jgi:branched-chain amino acid transport system substrate-binding protein
LLTSPYDPAAHLNSLTAEGSQLLFQYYQEGFMIKMVLALILTLLFSVTGFAADTVKIAITGPFSGGSAPMGTSMRDGAMLAISEINAAGGINVAGKKMKIEVIERDDEAKNERGALIAQELASMNDLSGVIGSVNTGVVIAGDKFLQEKEITKIITPAAGSASMTQWSKSGVKNLSIFRFAAHDGIQSAMVVEEAINRKLTKVAILHDSTNYGVSGRDDLLDQIKKQGNKLEIVATEKFNIGDKDMTAQLLKAKSGGARAILIWGIGPELAAVANGMAKMEMKMPLIGGWTLSMSNFIENAGKNGDGTLMPQTFIEEPITPRIKSFIDGYHNEYKVTKIPSPVSAAQGYDAVLIFAAAVSQAQSADTKKIKEALEDLNEPVKGVITTWKHPFSRWNPEMEYTHEAFHKEQAVMGMVKDGQVVFANDSDRRRLSFYAK